MSAFIGAFPCFASGAAARGLVLEPGIAIDRSNGMAAHISNGHSFSLEDGRKVRLAGVEAPRSAQGKQVAQPFSNVAASFLGALLQQKELALHDAYTDRFGRLRAHVFVNNNWVQGQMLGAGMARVRTWPDDTARVSQMLQLEQEARVAKQGLWNKSFYQVRNPQTLVSSVGSFQLVEGDVVDVAKGKTLTYLNFGTDWRRDFTVQADRKTARIFSRAGVELMGLAGAKVRVRGEIGSHNGPQIWLSHPAQLEILQA